MTRGNEKKDKKLYDILKNSQYLCKLYLSTSWNLGCYEVGNDDGCKLPPSYFGTLTKHWYPTWTYETQRSINSLRRFISDSFDISRSLINWPFMHIKTFIDQAISTSFYILSIYNCHRIRLLSLVVERCTCNAKVASSILAGGILFFLGFISTYFALTLE